MVTTDSLKQLPAYQAYLDHTNESWRRMPRHLVFSHQRHALSQSPIKSVRLRTVNGQLIETPLLSESQLVLEKNQALQDDFLYHQFNGDIYAMHLTMTPDLSQVVWEDSGDDPDAARCYQIHVKSGTQARLVEKVSHAGGVRRIDMQLEAHSHLLHIVEIDCEDDAHVYDHMHVELAESSQYTQVFVINSSRAVRRSLEVSMEGKYAQANISGSIISRLDHLVADHLNINHLDESTESQHHVKTLLFDEAKADIYSTVNISEMGEYSQSRQALRQLLFTDKALAFLKPALNISVDDVDCQHGAICGTVDEESMFFMQARGLEEQIARRLYAQGYIQSVYKEKLGDDCVKSLASKAWSYAEVLL